jgi:hypothetical protein
MEARYRKIRRPSFAKLAGSAPVKPGLSVRSLTHGVGRNGRSKAQGFRDKGGPNEHVGDPLRTAQIAELGAAAAQAISPQVDFALVVDAVRGAPPRVRAVRRAPLGGWVALEHHAIGGGCNAQDAETADLHCGRRMRSWERTRHEAEGRTRLGRPRRGCRGHTGWNPRAAGCEREQLELKARESNKARGREDDLHACRVSE